MTLLRNISVIWSYIHVLILFVFLFESRYSRKKTLLLTAAFMGPLCVANVLAYILLGPERAAQIVMLTCSVPSAIFFYVIAKNRDGRFFFTFCLADTVTYELIVITMLIDYYLAGNQYVFMLISRLLVFPAIELLVWKKLRKSYLELQQSVKRGWGAFAIVSAIFYILLIVMSVVPTVITERSDDLLALILVLIVMPLMYWNIFQVLVRQQKLYQTEEQARILRLQADMLTQQTERVEEAKNQLRISRHDLRHQLRTASGMLEKGLIEETQQYLSDADKLLDEAKVPHWCANPILDAVFGVYFRRAEAEGIRVDANLSIPDELPIDAAELSTVFANALENAIQACKQLPQEQRYIRCKCLSYPQFMFQISNPYAGTVKLDNKGLPVSDKRGHGIGIRSIAAFCEKHGVHYEFLTNGGVFSLRILLLG